MGNMGKYLAIISAFVVILTVLLSLAIPALFSWYDFTISGGGYSSGLYLTPFGTFIVNDYGSPDEIVGLVLIGGIMVLTGAGLCIAGVVKEIKVLGIIGGILIILGPTMLLIDLRFQISEFAQGMHHLVETESYNLTHALWGSFSPSPGVTVDFGITIGYFITYIAGILVFSGGLTI
ncbi:MAG: hypothetical protein ACFFAQ_11970 [Promethearchaeota archaeon]